MPLTVLICASCVVSSLFCIGLVGSWFFNCATSSVKKLPCRSDALFPVRDLEPLVLLVPVTPELVGSFTLTAMDMRVSFTGRE
ncbi:hypothetical protein D3C86_1787090 [compost metagenome]